MFIFFVFVLSKDSSVTLSLNVLTFVPVAISTRPKTLHGVRRKNAFPTCFNRPDWTTNVDQRAMRRSSQISTTGQYWWFMRDCLLSVQCIIRHTSSTYMHNGWAQLEQAFWKSAAVSHWLALVAPQASSVWGFPSYSAVTLAGGRFRFTFPQTGTSSALFLFPLALFSPMLVQTCY